MKRLSSDYYELQLLKMKSQPNYLDPNSFLLRYRSGDMMAVKKNATEDGLRTSTQLKDVSH
jgi:predicted DNA binding CopG/RHH family protein